MPFALSTGLSILVPRTPSGLSVVSTAVVLFKRRGWQAATRSPLDTSFRARCLSDRWDSNRRGPGPILCGRESLAMCRSKGVVGLARESSSRAVLFVACSGGVTRSRNAVRAPESYSLELIDSRWRQITAGLTGHFVLGE